MNKGIRVYAVIMLALLLLLSLSSSAPAVQKKGKKKKAVPVGRPVLWREPADIKSRDLFLGPGLASLGTETNISKYK